MKKNLMRRVAGHHDIRLDGMLDLTIRARESSVMDLGCNRGLVAYEMANNGATLVHGCDIYADGIRTARELFADLRAVESQFEVVDLTKGPVPLIQVFGEQRYDIVLMLATYHKLKRSMSRDGLHELMKALGARTDYYFAWRGTSSQINDNEDEIKAIDQSLAAAGLKRIHTSYISTELGVAAIWGRV